MRDGPFGGLFLGDLKVTPLGERKSHVTSIQRKVKMTDRIDILQRIVNLRELADSSGSEAEAMNAMKIADKMMAAYRIEEAELALAEGTGEITVDIANEVKFDLGLNVGRNRHKVQGLVWDLMRYCEVKVVIKNRTNWESRSLASYQGLNVIGDKPDVELFWYLLELCRDALDNEYARWRRSQQGVGTGAKASFQLAMVNRLGRRLNTLSYERKQEQNAAMEAEAKLLNRPVEDIRVAVNNGDLRELSSNMALVVMGAAQQKREAIADEFASAYKGARLGTASGFGYASNGGAAAAGRAAGDRVNFGRPVGGGSTGLLR